MPLQVKCGQCDTECAVPDSFAGKQIACPRCRSMVQVPGTAVNYSAPQGNQLLDMLDEELAGSGAAARGVLLGVDSRPAGSGLPARPHGPRRSRNSLRLSRRTGLVVAGVGSLAFFVLTVVTVSKLGLVLGWLLLATGLATLFTALCWLLYLLLCVPYSRQRGLAFYSLLLGLGVCAVAVLGILGANRLIQAGEGGGEIAATTPGDATASRDADEKGVPLTPPAAGGSQAAKRVSQPVAPGGASGHGTAQTARPRPATAPGGTPDQDIPPNPDLVTYDQPRIAGGPRERIVAAAPPPDPNASPLEKAYEEASRDYGTKIAVDLLASEDPEFTERVLWYADANRPTLGFRWALGVRAAGAPGLPELPISKAMEKRIGSVSRSLVSGLEKRINLGTFGRWPDTGDPHVRQVALLRNGRHEELVAAARRRGLDMLAVVDPLGENLAPNQGPERLKIHLFDLIEARTVATFPQGGPAKGGDPAKASDPALTLANEVLVYLDDKLTLQPVPWLLNDQAKARIAKLPSIQPRPENGLALLVEIRYFQARQLLLPDRAVPLYESILGRGNGEGFVRGDSAKRRELLQAWLQGPP